MRRRLLGNRGVNGDVSDGQIQLAFTIKDLVVAQLKSEDSGSTFTETQPFGSGYSLRNGVISSNGQIITTCDGDKIIKSLNGGVNWTVQSLLATSVGISDNGQIISRVHSSGVYVSNDEGSTWNQSLVADVKFISVSYSGQYQLAVPYATPYVSSDYGVSWAQYGVSKTYQACAMSLDGKYMIAAAFNSALSYSSDYGVTWVDKGISQQLYTCAISNDGQHIVMGGNTFIRVSNDGGATWQDKGVNLNTWIYSAISGSGQYMMIANTSSSVVYKSNDYGATWTTFGTANNWKAVVINRTL